MTDSERLNEVIKFYNLSTPVFSRRIGLKGPQSLYDIFKGRNRISKNISDLISANCPEINIGWLLTGEGEMLKGGDAKKDIETSACSISRYSYENVPVLNLDAVAGMKSWNDIADSPEYIEGYVPFIGARKGDFCVRVSGNSMIPTHCPGSLLLVREVEDWKEYFGYGHCFVLFLRDGRRILKEVQKFIENPKEYVLCVSHNKEYPEEELPKSMITKVFKVIMGLTYEGF